jgi:SAM-dependent methyltransferase
MQPAHTDDQLEGYRWLASTDGQRLMASIRQRLDACDSILKVSESLRAEHPPQRVALALTQVELRHAARAKFVNAERLLLTREGLEQATSDRIAGHRAIRYEGYPVIVDLCCGVGGDLMALASLPGGRQLTAVDIDPVHLALAVHNAGVVAPDRRVRAVRDDVRNVRVEPDAAVFIDPARRDTRGRMGGYASEPPLEWGVALADRAAGVGIKAAPGIPHDLVPGGWELETIALGPELKEAVLWSPALATAPRSATVIDDTGIHRLFPVEGDPVLIREPEAGAWLLDPNPAVTRAGLVEDLARSIGAKKIDDEIGFLVANQPVDSPFARSLRIIGSMPWHEKQVKRFLREVDAGSVTIRRRGLAGDVAAITKRLRGDGFRQVTIAMTRHIDQPWCIVCEATQNPNL